MENKAEEKKPAVNPMAKAYVEVLLAMTKTIKAATETSPLGGIPAGHLYANMMHGCSLETFESLVSMLVRFGLVERKASHLLVYVHTTKADLGYPTPCPACQGAHPVSCHGG